MKKNKKNLNVILSMILCALLLCSGFHVCSVVEVKADSAGITGFLKNNKTYKYDLNGNKKKEKIKLRVTKRNYYINVSFYINGKKVWTMSEKEQWEYVGYKIIKLSNGKRFIYFFAEGPNPGISSHRILQYKKGRMKTVANITDLFKKYQGASMISWYPASENGITVSGKEIKVYFVYSIRITVNSIRNDGTTRRDPGNGGKPRKIKGFSELMKRGGTRIDMFFEKRAHFSEQKEKLSTLSTKRAGKPHKQRVPGSFLNWNE